MSHRVFVYGTLKQGQPNHHVITQCKAGKYTLLGQGRTVSKWPLVITTHFNVPFLLDIEGQGHNVVGEIYEVDDALLADLDDLEGYPGYYDRRLVSIKMEERSAGVETADVMDCWLYMLDNYKPFMKDLETYENYDSNGSHGKRYVSRCDRDDSWADGYMSLILNNFSDELKSKYNLK